MSQPEKIAALPATGAAVQKFTPNLHKFRFMAGL